MDVISWLRLSIIPVRPIASPRNIVTSCEFVIKDSLTFLTTIGICKRLVIKI